MSSSPISLSLTDQYSLQGLFAGDNTQAAIPGHTDEKLVQLLSLMQPFPCLMKAGFAKKVADIVFLHHKIISSDRFPEDYTSTNFSRGYAPKVPVGCLCQVERTGQNHTTARMNEMNKGEFRRRELSSA